LAKTVEAASIAAAFREDIRRQLTTVPERLKLVGFLSAESGPCVTYANYTRLGCEDVGIDLNCGM
jgi:hypothetical protein